MNLKSFTKLLSNNGIEYFFTGSYAFGRFTEYSDIDIVVLKEGSELLKKLLEDNRDLMVEEGRYFDSLNIFPINTGSVGRILDERKINVIIVPFWEFKAWKEATDIMARTEVFKNLSKKTRHTVFESLRTLVKLASDV